MAESGSLCVVIGGSGNGEQIAANKVIGARAALAYNLDTAKLGRQHNDANVIAIGARMHTEEEALEMVRMFLATPFSGDERHARPDPSAGGVRGPARVGGSGSRWTPGSALAGRRSEPAARRSPRRRPARPQDRDATRPALASHGPR